MTTPFDESTNKVESFLSNITKKDLESVFAVTLRIIENDDSLRGLYRWNEFSNDIEHTGKVGWSDHIKEGKPLTDNDLTEISVLLAKKYDFSPPIVRIEQAIKSIALRKPYHPIKDYLEDLKWDGVERLSRWLIEICGVEDNPYTQAVSRKVLTAAVARIYEPGCKFDYMAILEGVQGIRKTTLIEILAGAKYTTSISFTMSNKDIVDTMRGKWILEIKEMHGFGKAEVERVKALLDQHTDRVRLSYGRRAEDFQRNSIMLGTMNPLGDNKYLSDETGNRRFWPIACNHGNIKIDLLREMRDQLWAEAVWCYRKHEPLYMETEVLEGMAKVEQEERLLLADPWDHAIFKYLNECERKMQNQVTANQIMEEALHIPPERMSRGYAGRIGRAVKKHGAWELKKISKGQHRGYYYQLITDEEINWEGESTPTQPTGTQIEPTGRVVPSQE